jgi:hypothetical protein
MKLIPIYKLDICHWCIITTAVKRPQDPCIATISISISFRCFCEHAMHNQLVIHECQSLPPLVQRPVLGQRYHPIHKAAYGLGARQRRLNAAVLKQLCSEATDERLALVGWTVQSCNALPMPHCIDFDAPDCAAHCLAEPHDLCRLGKVYYCYKRRGN